MMDAHTCTRYSLESSGRRTCSIRWAKCSCRTSLSWLTQAITASKTCAIKHRQTKLASQRVRPSPRECSERGDRVHLLLGGDGELVAGDQAGHLLHAQIEELFAPDNLCEMLLWETKRHFHSVNTLSFFLSPNSYKTFWSWATEV